MRWFLGYHQFGDTQKRTVLWTSASVSAGSMLLHIHGIWIPFSPALQMCFEENCTLYMPQSKASMMATVSIGSNQCTKNIGKVPISCTLATKIAIFQKPTRAGRTVPSVSLPCDTCPLRSPGCLSAISGSRGTFQGTNIVHFENESIWKSSLNHLQDLFRRGYMLVPGSFLDIHIIIYL